MCVLTGRRVHAVRRARAFALPSAERAVVCGSGAYREGEWAQGIGYGPCQEVVVDFLNLGDTFLGVKLRQAFMDLETDVDLPRVVLASRDYPRAQVPDSRRDDGCVALGEHHEEVVNGESVAVAHQAVTTRGQFAGHERRGLRVRAGSSKSRGRGHAGFPGVRVGPSQGQWGAPFPRLVHERCGYGPRQAL